MQNFGQWRARIAACTVIGVACAGLGMPAASAAAPVDPPVITTPADLAVAAGDLVVSAQAPAGATHVQFQLAHVDPLLDSTTDAFVDVVDGVATTTLSTYTLKNGDHLLTAVGCADLCGEAAADVMVSVQNPTITAVKYSPFSPNADRRRDTVALTYSLPADSSVAFSIRNALGATVYSTPAAPRPAGLTTVTWNGRNSSGAVVPAGTYTARIDTTRTVGDPATTLTAYATKPVVVDLVAPYLTSPSGARRTFFPYREGYRDYFQPAITVNETAALTLRIYTSTGKWVRTLPLGYKAKGRRTASWNGRKADGTKLRAGTYLFAWTVRDVAGNERRTGRSSFKLSWQRAVLRSASKKLAATSSRYGTYVGSCSLVRTAAEIAAGALELRSNGKAQDGVDCDGAAAGFDIAQTRHRISLPAAEYKAIRVTVTGSDAYGFGTGTLSVHYPSGRTATARSLPKTLGSYPANVVGPGVRSSTGYVRWRVTAREGHSWSPRTFTVAYSWWVRI